jgi:hypothetical protein
MSEHDKEALWPHQYLTVYAVHIGAKSLPQALDHQWCLVGKRGLHIEREPQPCGQ